MTAKTCMDASAIVVSALCQGTFVGLAMHGGVCGVAYLFPSLFPAPAPRKPKKKSAWRVTLEHWGVLRRGDIERYFGGEMDGADIARFANHLKDCARCRLACEQSLAISEGKTLCL